MPALFVSVQQAAAINANTAISLATVIVLLGAAWKISAVLTELCVQMKPLVKLPEELAKLRSEARDTRNEVREVRSHIEGLEEDVSILWTSARGEPLSQTRHRSRRTWADKPPQDND